MKTTLKPGETYSVRASYVPQGYVSYYIKPFLPCCETIKQDNEIDPDAGFAVKDANRIVAHQKTFKHRRAAAAAKLAKIDAER